MHDIFKYVINEKHVITIIYDIMNPQKYVIFKYVINKKHVITIIFMTS